MPDLDRNKSDWLTTSFVVVLFFVSGILIIDRVIPPGPLGPTITLEWDVNDSRPGVVTEVWGTTNLVDWYHVTNAVGGWVRLPRDKPQEFFKVRNRLGDEVSDWARK